jgi:hypothetical protein
MQPRNVLRIFLVLFALACGSLALAAPATAQVQCGGYIIVQRGDTLGRISRRYGVSIRALAVANHITNINRIYYGQRLYIPCGSEVPTATPNPYATPGYYPTNVYGTPGAPGYPTGSIDCTGFRATSPVDGFPDGSTTFYWDAPRSGTVSGYTVYVLNEGGQYVASFNAGAFITRTSGDVSFNAIGRGINFSWYVVALSNGSEACRSQLVKLRREWSNQQGS